MSDDAEAEDRRAALAASRARTELQMTGAAFAELRAKTIEQIIASAPEQVAFRERMIVTCQILDAVKATLEDIVTAGTYAEAALAQNDLLRR